MNELDEQLIRELLFLWYNQGEYSERKWQMFLNRLSRDHVRIEELHTKATDVIALVRRSKP